VSNTFQGKGDIRIHEAKNVTVEGNTFSTDGATAWGIYVDSEGGSVANNVVDSGAIWLGGTGTTVQTNTVRDTDISLSSDHFALEIGGDGHDVRNNTVVNANRGMGVGGRDHVLRDNELRNSRENFHVGTFRSTTDADPASFDVDQSNTVDGKPIYVFGGVSGHTLSGVNAGYVAYADSTDVTVRDVRVYADRTRLLNVFENVFRNSVEHGGPDVAIRLVGHPGGFAVADDGPGIPFEERESCSSTSTRPRKPGPVSGWPSWTPSHGGTAGRSRRRKGTTAAHGSPFPTWTSSKTRRTRSRLPPDRRLPRRSGPVAVVDPRHRTPPRASVTP
jgi:hypothetical protein